MQLLWVIVVLNILVVSGYIWPWHSPRLPLPVGLGLFGIFLFGIVGTQIAISRLKNGIESGRWPDALVDGSRKIVTHTAISIFKVSLIIFGLVYMISSHRGHSSGIWMFLWPAMSINNVVNAFRPRQANPDQSSLPGPPKPLQSEYWGTPPRPFSN